MLQERACSCISANTSDSVCTIERELATKAQGVTSSGAFVAICAGAAGAAADGCLGCSGGGATPRREASTCWQHTRGDINT